MKSNKLGLFVLVVLMAIFCLTVTGHAAEDEKSLTVALSSKFFTKYVGDTGKNFYNKPVQQTDLTLTFSNGLYFDLWNSVSWKDSGRNTNYGNETDYAVGWGGEVFGLTADLGVSYWDLLEEFHFGRGDILQPYAGISKEFAITEKHSLTPSIKLEYGIPVQGNSIQEKGFHVHLFLAHKWQAMETISFLQKAMLGYDAGAYGGEHAWIGSYEGGLSWQVSKSVAIEASGRVIGPLHHVSDRKTEVIGSFGPIFNF